MNGEEFKSLWKLGFGHFHGLDCRNVRVHHDESAVRRVLRAMEAGLTEFNLKESDQLAFCFSRFLIRRDFDQKKLYWATNLEVREGGWYLRHQSYRTDYGGDENWKLWITFNGRDC